MNALHRKLHGEKIACVSIICPFVFFYVLFVYARIHTPKQLTIVSFCHKPKWIFRFVRSSHKWQSKKSSFMARCINSLPHSMPLPLALMCVKGEEKIKLKNRTTQPFHVAWAIQHKLVATSCAGDALVAQQHWLRAKQKKMCRKIFWRVKLISWCKHDVPPFEGCFALRSSALIFRNDF